MDKIYFITLTGLSHYYGKKPFEVGRVVKLIKEPENEYDDEAIGVYLPYIDRIAYVANSANTVFGGTVSAGRIYDKFDDYAYAEILFITHSSAIARFLDKDEVEEVEITEPEKAQEKKEKPAKKTGKAIGFKAV